MTFKMKRLNSDLESVVLGVASLIDVGGALSEPRNFRAELKALEQIGAESNYLKRRRQRGIGRYFRAVGGDFRVAMRKLEAEARQEPSDDTADLSQSVGAPSP